ncbi:hypothetical protein Tco_1429501 [Tanacetum coccineum]
MRTRRSSKFVGEPSTNPTSMIPKRRNRRRSIQRVEPFSLIETPVVTMADQRTMRNYSVQPTEGYTEAIVVPPIPAEHFELKHSLINLVTSKQFFGFEKEDPHAHIRYFNKDFTSHVESTRCSGSLPSNTIANPRGDLKGITTRSGISYNRPPITPLFFSLPKVVEREPESKPSIPYPSRANKQKLHEKDDNLALKFVEIFRELHSRAFSAFADALLHTPKFATMFKILLNNKEKLFELATTTSMNAWPWPISVQADLYFYNNAESINRIDVIDVACREYAQEVLGFSKISISGNPTSEPIISTSSPTLTPFRDNDFLLEETDAFLAIEDDSISPEIDDSYYNSEGDIRLLEEFLNDDPLSPLTPQELRFVEPKTKKTSIDDPLELELKDLPFSS